MKSHLKRLASPKIWKIRKKKIRFVTKPKGSLKYTMPLNVVLRDILKYSKTTKETKVILQTKEVLVNGRRIKDHRFGIGLMSILAIPSIGEFYRVLLDKKGKLFLLEIKKEESNVKPCKIINKKILKKKKIQINLFDGRNILVDKDSYKVGDSVLMEFPQKIKDHFKLEKGATIYLVGGRHVGETGVVEDIKGRDITFKAEAGVEQTKRRYAFIVGKTKPVIALK